MGVSRWKMSIWSLSGHYKLPAWVADITESALCVFSKGVELFIEDMSYGAKDPWNIDRIMGLGKTKLTDLDKAKFEGLTVFSCYSLFELPNLAVRNSRKNVY